MTEVRRMTMSGRAIRLSALIYMPCRTLATFPDLRLR